MSATARADAFGPQLQITNQGPPADPAFRAGFQDVAYNPFTGQHLVVYIGSTSATVDDVYGRFVGIGGAPVGLPFKISQTALGDDEFNPANVSYNPTLNEWLVSWSRDTNEEVYVRRLAANGTPLTPERLVATGQVDIETTRIAWSPDSRRYLVVWKGDSSSTGVVYGRFVGADGTPVGVRFGIIGTPNVVGTDDAVSITYNGRSREFLVVTRARIGMTQEYEIFGQRVALDGSQPGANDFRISNMGPDGDAMFQVQPPDVAYNSRLGQYLVAWTARDTGFVGGHFEVFGQLLAADGTPIGADDFQISNMGSVTAAEPGARRPTIAFNPNANQYLVAWHGDTVVPPMVDEEFEVFGRILGAGGGGLSNQFQISSTPPAGNDSTSANRPRADYNATTCDYYVTWTVGNVSTGNDVPWELFGRRVSAPACPPPPPRDTVAPVLSVLKASPSAFAARVGPSSARRRQARSTTFSYRLSENASVRFTIQRRTIGRRVGGTCRKRTRSNRRRRACTRYVRVGAFTQAGKAGRNKRRFNGKLRGKRLKAARYRAVVVATDAAGNRSASRRVRFRVAKRR